MFSTHPVDERKDPSSFAAIGATPAAAYPCPPPYPSVAAKRPRALDSVALNALGNASGCYCPSTGSAEAIASNNLGASCYNASGDYDRALGFFLAAQRAVRSCSDQRRSSLASHSSHVSIGEEEACANMLTEEEKEGRLPKHGDHHQSASEKQCARPYSDRDRGGNNNNKWQFQQLTDFDEGMHTFMDALVLEEEDIVNMGYVETVILFNLAQCRQRRGEHDDASGLFERAYELLMATMSTSPTQPGDSRLRLLIRVLHKIGQLQYFRGSYEEAKRSFRDALHLSQKVLGNDHPDVATALNSLGIVHYHTSSASTEVVPPGERHAYSLELLHEALQIRAYGLGVNNRDVAMTLNNIARIYVEREELDDALVTYEEALRIRREALGDRHPDVAATTFNIGQTHHLKGEYDAAMDYYNDFLRLVTARCGTDEPNRDVSIVLCLMGEIYQEGGNLERAMTLYSTALQVGIAALGSPLHAEMALILNKIGSCQLERGDVDAAIRSFEEGLEIERMVFDPCHPNVMVTLRNIGELRRQRGEYDAALERYREILGFRIERLLSIHPNCFGILDQFGGLLAREQRRERQNPRRVPTAGTKRTEKKETSNISASTSVAEEWRALRDGFLDVSEAVNDIATLYCKKGSYNLALQYLEESLRIQRAILGRDHRDIAVTLCNMAAIHRWNEDRSAALACCRESLRVKRLASGNDPVGVATVLHLMGQIFQEMEELDEALEHHEEALRIERHVLGNDGAAANTNVAEILTDIGNIHREKGRFAEMMKAFTEAARIYILCGLSPDNISVSENKRLGDMTTMADSMVAPAA